jgi:GNAT superfamily N-acetyltransferase
VLLVREFQVAGRTVRGGLIGSVATDPAWRGRGLATRLLARAERELAARGCLFTLLWANEASYYLERGYAPFGVENDFLLVPGLARELPRPTGVRELRPGDAQFLHRIHRQHAAHVERSPAETEALLALPGMLVLVRERAAASGQPALPVAYACLGRGRDLADAIHEWGGPCEDVLALVRAHLERRFPAGEQGALFLMAPPQAGDVAYHLMRHGAVSKRGILGLGKLLDAGAAARLLGDLLGARDAVTLTGRGIHVGGELAAAEIDLDTLQAVLFGGPDVRDEVRAFLQRLGFEHVRLPLEPFAFGLDSI